MHWVLCLIVWSACATGIPQARTYADVTAIAEAINREIPCEPRRLESPHQDLDFAQCFQDSGHLSLWVFPDRATRDSWAMSITAEVDALLGPNWIVTPSNADLQEVQKVIGGRLVT